MRTKTTATWDDGKVRDQNTIHAAVKIDSDRGRILVKHNLGTHTTTAPDTETIKKQIDVS